MDIGLALVTDRAVSMYANRICVEITEKLAEKMIELLNRLHKSTNSRSPHSWSEGVTKYLELYS